MQRYLLTTPLLAILLLGTLGCSKKEAATPAVGTGSFTLDGTTIAGQARAYTGSTVAGTQTTDVLYINLSDTPTQQSTSRTVLLTFNKPTGQPTTAYVLTNIIYSKDGSSQGVTYANNVTTLTETSTGVFSGTFSGTAASSSVISKGIFTDARL